MLTLLRLLALALLATPVFAGEDPNDAYLRENKLEPTSEALIAFLDSVRATPENKQHAVEMVKQLGAEDYEARERAAAELIHLGLVAAEAVEAGKKDDDSEVRMRCIHLAPLVRGGQSASVLSAALRKLATLKSPGAVPHVLALMPQLEGHSLFTQAARTLRFTARADEAELSALRNAAKTGSVPYRAATIEALGAALGAKGADETAGFLAAPEPEIKIAAALALARAGDSRCLTPLGALLDADPVQVRSSAAQTLRNLTGQKLPFAAYDEPAKRKASADAWRAWIAKDGATAKLNLPLSDAHVILGRTLICLYGNNKVIELDAEGKETFSVEAANSWGAYGLPNGHRIITFMGQAKVAEYDETGKEIWSKDGLPGNPMSVQGLENGNVLMALSDGHKVVEVDHAGTIVWTKDFPGLRPLDAQRLENGNTLIALYSGGKVIEIDPTGKQVMEIGSLPEIVSATKLENGNLLTCLWNGEVREIDPGGKEIMKFTVANPGGAQRMDDGNTLVSHQGGLTLFNPKGEKVWEKAVGGAGGKMHSY